MGMPRERSVQFNQHGSMTVRLDPRKCTQVRSMVRSHIPMLILVTGAMCASISIVVATIIRGKVCQFAGSPKADRLTFLYKRVQTVLSLWPHHRGGPQRREPRKNFSKSFRKVSWSRSRRFSCGFAPYLACGKLYTFPMCSACAPAP